MKVDGTETGLCRPAGWVLLEQLVARFTSTSPIMSDVFKGSSKIVLNF